MLQTFTVLAVSGVERLRSYGLTVLAGAFLLLTMSASAQSAKTTFTGTIVDEADLPIPGATVMILDAADSTLILFGSSNTSGDFTIKNVTTGDYLLNVNFLGMAPVFLPVTAGLEAEKNIGSIKMQPASKVLNPVEVTADYVPIEITKDTISYNADAFETQPNAVVEDLLKKLPGIEVAADGSIKAQGEDVQKVLVDGKEFFGDDPKMATKNLPAKALKKVKVYDKQSETSEFTGVDDGLREKTIDLQLKDEFKKGLFGTAQAGYGTDERYNARASLNKFSQTYQLSFLGQFNNINDQGFSFQDRMNFSGGMGGMRGGMGGGGMRTMEMTFTSGGGGGGVPMNFGQSSGVTRTGAAGLNFNFQQSKNFNIRSSYFYNNVNKDLLENSFRQNIGPDPFDTDKENNENTINRSHSFSLNSDWQIDSTTQLQLTSRAGFGDGDADGISALQNLVSGQSTLISQSQTEAADGSDNSSFSGGLSIMKRLNTKGRNFSVNGNLSKNETDTESALESITEYFQTGDPDVLLNQLQYSISDDTRYDAQFSYTEPLQKRRFFEVNYGYNQVTANYEKRVNDITDTSVINNPGLSTDYQSVFTYHRPGATFRYSGEVHNITVGAHYQMSELDGRLEQSENTINRKYEHLLPRFIWRWDIGNGKNMRFNYTTRVNQPSITQLSPVIDNSDPLRLYVGNENLDAEYSHNMSLNFHSFSQFSSTSLFASVSGTITKDRIITSTTTDANLVQTSKPINIDNESRLTFYTSFGRPFKPIHSRFTVNANFTYTRTQNSINSELLDLNRWSRTAGLTISNMNSKVLEYNLGARYTFSDSYYKVDENLNQNTLNSNYFVDATVTVWKKWRIGGSYDYNLYSSDEFGEDQALPMMKFTLSRYVLPGDKGELRFAVFDVLDENRGLSRSADINYLEEIRSNSIGRYAMFSFIYSIRGAAQGPGGPPGEFRIIERRG